MPVQLHAPRGTCHSIQRPARMGKVVRREYRSATDCVTLDKLLDLSEQLVSKRTQRLTPERYHQHST